MAKAKSLHRTVVRRRDGQVETIRVNGKLISSNTRKKLEAFQPEEKYQPWELCIVPNCGKPREHVKKNPHATSFCKYHFDTMVRKLNK